MTQYKLFWGDTHVNHHGRHINSETLSMTLAEAHERLDFLPMAYYPQERFKLKGFNVEDYLPDERITERGLRAYAIPHHTAYKVGVRAKDWSVHDEALSPFAEVYSHHGSSESDEQCPGLWRNRNMGPGTAGGTIEDGLNSGLKFGIIASNDCHGGVPGIWDWGLMACYAEQLTRESLWEAFAARRVYGVTGDRIELGFTVDGAMMGSAIAKAGPVQIQTTVRGCDAIDRIELLRNNRVIATHCHQGTWDPPDGEPNPQANIFEIHARPADTIRLDLDGKRVEMTLAEAMAGSRIVSWMDEAGKYVREQFGIDPESLPRNDRLYFTGHRAKIHRAIPEVGYCVQWDSIDENPPAGGRISTAFASVSGTGRWPGRRPSGWTVDASGWP